MKECSEEGEFGKQGGAGEKPGKDVATAGDWTQSVGAHVAL